MYFLSKVGGVLPEGCDLDIPKGHALGLFVEFGCECLNSKFVGLSLEHGLSDCVVRGWRLRGQHVHHVDVKVVYRGSPDVEAIWGE